MKYRDESGKIVIDSNEAAADIKKLRQADALLAELSTARAAADSDSFWLGDARLSYDARVSSINRNIAVTRQSIQDAINEIQNAVEKYKKIDKTLAATFADLAKGVF